MFLDDVRYALRALKRSPGFAAVAILSLALGIGANAAIFSLIDAVMLRSLPISHSEELLQVTPATPQFFSNPIWEQIRDRQDVFRGIFAYGRWRFNLAPGGEARYANGQFVSGGYFDTLQVRAALGRTLTTADDRRGCAGAAVLSHRFWQQEYGGRPDVVGKTISLNRQPIEIAGVAEPGFAGIDVGSTVDVMVPLCAERIIHGETSNLDINAVAGSNTLIYAWLRVVGRPNPGVAPSQATARLQTLAPEIYRATLPRHWRPEDQDEYLKRTLITESFAKGLSAVRDQYSDALLILLAITCMVLLIACANVANLLLARGAARRREIAIRMALGSTRGRLVRQVLTESLLLSGAGALLGVLFASWATRLLVRFLDVHLDLTPDLRVLAFTSGVAVVTGLLFGIVPAWRGTRVDPQTAMHGSSRGIAEGSRFGPGRMLVAAQVALSLLLVVTAGLLLSTFWRLATLDPGFDGSRVLLMEVDLRNGRYLPEQRPAAFQEMLRQVGALPGIHSAGLSGVAPVCGCKASNDLLIEGRSAVANVHRNQVSPGYFETLGMSITAGRNFNDSDTPASPAVALINQAMARKYFADGFPLGRRFRIQNGNTLGDPFEIVGLVSDAKYASLRQEIPPTFYRAWSQNRTPQPQVTFEVRSAAGAPTALIAGIKTAIGVVNRDVSIEFTTLAAKVDDSLSRERLLAALSGFFGGLALLLATIGLYGLMQYTVTRRRNEIAIRMALGAGKPRVLRMILREVALLTGGGLVAGLVLSLLTARFLTSFLYGLTPADPVIWALAASALAVVAGLAGYLPARQAAQTDPMTALRDD